MTIKKTNKSFSLIDKRGNVIIKVIRKNSKEASFEIVKEQMDWFVDWYNYNDGIKPNQAIDKTK